MLAPGDAAPDFELPDQHGDPTSLSDFHGRTVVLYFYPKAGTKGCTTQACSFRDRWDAYRAAGVQVLGASTDTVEEQAAFAADESLPFPLLADAEGEVARAYESLATDDPDGEGYEALRNTYVIGPDGVVQAAYEDVTPQAHATAILEAIDG